MGNSYYIAACVFTERFPELSAKIQQYIKQRYDMQILRCCVPNHKVKEYEQKMMQNSFGKSWSELLHCTDFMPGDTVYSICHNCSNIIEETRPGVKVLSLWELILSDESFVFPDRSGMKAVIQDCWRANERVGEQNAVRELLKKMNIDFIEADKNGIETDFCGASLYRAQPPRNPAIAPIRYVQKAKGKFIPHTPEQQQQIMKEHCEKYERDTVICYCHYCLEGLIMGGADGIHIASLLFD